MEDLLRVNGLRKEYKGFTLGDLSFSLPPGYILGMVGVNGAGKTTALHCVCHLHPYEAGEILVNGKTFAEDPVAYKEAIGFIADTSFFPGNMRLKNIRAILRDFYATFDEKVFESYVERWRLPGDRPVSQYSRGMLVKLMFACVLSRENKLLILDEATNGLDPLVREEILDILKDYVSDGTRSILFSTHILSDLEDLTDYLVLLDNGKQKLFASIEEVRSGYRLLSGGPNDLTDSLRRDLLGLREKNFGFEGLIEAQKAQNLSGLLTREPSIDEVVRFLCLSDRTPYAVGKA